MIRLIAGMLMVVLWASAQAAPNCDAIIAHGLRNVEEAESAESAIAISYFSHCQKNFDLMTDEQLAEAEANVYMIWDASGSYTRKQHQEHLQQWCTTNKSRAERHGYSTIKAQQFYQGAVTAWQDCNALANQGLIISERSSIDRKVIDIGVFYNGHTADGILLTGLVTRGYSCTTTGPDAKPITFPRPIKNLTHQIHCERQAPVRKTRDGQEYDYVPEGSITIQSAAEPYQLYFTEEYDPGLPRKLADQLRQEAEAQELPVGTVISSTLPPALFLSKGHPQGGTGQWIVADGGLLPNGSEYGRLTGERNAPDLRDVGGSLLLLDVRAADLKSGENVASIVNQSDAKNGKWTWLSSLRIAQGMTYNNDWEQDTDKFENYIDASSGTVVIQGATYNRKYGKWGTWNPGEASVLGLATRRNPLYYYLKIN